MEKGNSDRKTLGPNSKVSSNGGGDQRSKKKRKTIGLHDLKISGGQRAGS